MSTFVLKASMEIQAGANLQRAARKDGLIISLV
jgi:hypothetical protein